MAVNEHGVSVFTHGIPAILPTVTSTVALASPGTVTPPIETRFVPSKKLSGTVTEPPVGTFLTTHGTRGPPAPVLPPGDYT